MADNDGELNADKHIAQFFLDRSKKGDLVIISRWYDGVHIGPIRWRIMKDLVKEVLDRRDQPEHVTDQSSSGLHKIQVPNTAAGLHKTGLHKVHSPSRNEHQRDGNIKPNLLLLSDSTMDKQVSTEGIQIPTLKNCINAVSHPKAPRTSLVVGTGANDVDKSTPDHHRDQLVQLADKLHENYPTSKVYMLAIPPGTDSDRNIKVRQFNKVIEEVCREHQFIFLDTFTLLETKCADPKHPSPEGKKLLTKVISSVGQGNALGMVRKLTEDALLERQTSYADTLKPRTSTSENPQPIQTIVGLGSDQSAKQGAVPCSAASTLQQAPTTPV